MSSNRRSGSVFWAVTLSALWPLSFCLADQPQARSMTRGSTAGRTFNTQRSQSGGTPTLRSGPAPTLTRSAPVRVPSASFGSAAPRLSAPTMSTRPPLSGGSVLSSPGVQSSGSSAPVGVRRFTRSGPTASAQPNFSRFNTGGSANPGVQSSVGTPRTFIDATPGGRPMVVPSQTAGIGRFTPGGSVVTSNRHGHNGDGHSSVVVPPSPLPSTVGPGAAVSPYGHYPWSPARSPVVAASPRIATPGRFGFARVYRDDFVYRPHGFHRPHGVFGFGFMSYPAAVAVPYPVAVPTPVYPQAVGPYPAPDAGYAEAPPPDAGYAQGPPPDAGYAQAQAPDPGYAQAQPASGGYSPTFTPDAGEAQGYATPDAEGQQQTPVGAPPAQMQAGAENPSGYAEQPDAGQTDTYRPRPSPDAPANEGDGRAQELMQQINQGVEMFTAGDYDRAARTFLQVAMAQRENVDAWLAYAVARFATGDYGMAATAIRRGVGQYPEVVNAGFDIRSRYGQKADFEKHLMTLDRYLREKQDSRDGWLTLGFVLHFSGMRPQGNRVFEMIQKRFPADAEMAGKFLKAKAAPPPQQDQGDDQNDAQPQQGQPAPAPGDGDARGQDGNPVETAVNSERGLRDSGATQSGPGAAPVIPPEPAYELPAP